MIISGYGGACRSARTPSALCQFTASFHEPGHVVLFAANTGPVPAAAFDIRQRPQHKRGRLGRVSVPRMHLEGCPILEQMHPSIILVTSAPSGMTVTNDEGGPQIAEIQASLTNPCMISPGHHQCVEGHPFATEIDFKIAPQRKDCCMMQQSWQRIPSAPDRPLGSTQQLRDRQTVRSPPSSSYAHSVRPMRIARV